MANQNTGAYITATGRRKTATARVLLRKGEGKISVNKQDIGDYFRDQAIQKKACRPLELLPEISKFDLQINVRGSGFTGQAGAMSHGIARVLLDALKNENKKFKEMLMLDIPLEEFTSTLRRDGYLTRDSRKKERKKVGLVKARKDKQFSKR